eukprot:460901-Pleurochrysis_carterae.AAC.1
MSSRGRLELCCSLMRGGWPSSGIDAIYAAGSLRLLPLERSHGQCEGAALQLRGTIVTVLNMSRAASEACTTALNVSEVSTAIYITTRDESRLCARACVLGVAQARHQPV